MGVASRCPVEELFLILFGLRFKKKICIADLMMKCESEMKGMSESFLF